MNKRRLLKLADFLMTVSVKRFDISRWVGGDWNGRPNLSCGTVACAIGWATTIPSFRRAGLTLARNGYDAVNPQYGAYTGFDAAAKFFDIDIAEDLFADFSYKQTRVTPKMVARRIRDLVNNA